jgi:hypothetical protein
VGVEYFSVLYFDMEALIDGMPDLALCIPYLTGYFLVLYESIIAKQRGWTARARQIWVLSGV